MRSSAVLLLLGALPGLSFVLPDEDMKSQFVLDKSRERFSEVQEKFHSLEDKFEKELNSLAEELQRSKPSTSHGDDKAYDRMYVEHLLSESQADDKFEFDCDCDAASQDYVGAPDGDAQRNLRFPPNKPDHPKSTLWDLISNSKHSTKFAEFLKKDQDVVDYLKSKDANITVFAPTNEAFERLEKLCPKEPSKELIHKVLEYHLAPGTHCAQDLFFHNTITSGSDDEDLGKNMHQRIRIGFRFHKGFSANFYSKLIATNIFGENGVIHAVDNVLLPPPDVLDIIGVLPIAFSTSEVALYRTGLIDEIPKLKGKGLTVFIPTNREWMKLGIKVNAFLFSKYGTPWLRALMKYHIVPGHTLYSDALVVPGDKKNVGAKDEVDDPNGLNQGYSHVDLPTLLEGRHLAADIYRFGRFLHFTVNGRNHIVVSDGIAKSGVLHVPDNILLPPHCKDENNSPAPSADEDEDAEVTAFKRILAPFVEQEKIELAQLGRNDEL